MRRRRASTTTDLNLLLTLDALLAEGSVTAAAESLSKSPAAISRQLSRIRRMLGDPILVRAGRNLVPTPRAEALRPRLEQLLREAHALVQGVGEIDPSTLERTFTIRSSDGFVSTYGARIADAIRASAPRARLRFVSEGDEDVASLRDGRVDVDVGVIDDSGPEIRVQTLFRDRYVGVVRYDHPLPSPVSLEGFLAYPHVSVSRRGRFEGPVDAALARDGRRRSISVAVANHADGIAIAAQSDHIVLVPERLTSWHRRAHRTFDVPLKLGRPAVVCAAWHPRFSADGAHTLLRDQLRLACASLAK